MLGSERTAPDAALTYHMLSDHIERPIHEFGMREGLGVSSPKCHREEQLRKRVQASNARSITSRR